jgi:fibrillin 2/3
VDNSGGNCTDVDECASPQSCLYGTCVNTEGAFECHCPPDHELIKAGTACVDKRQAQCFLEVEEGPGGRRRCDKALGQPVTRATCCCSVGKAWGPRCEDCPAPESEEYSNLCPGGKGYRPNTVTVSFVLFLKL